ncbi:glycosyltransferase family 87 protein [Phenylobacterium soli]|uniref:glycosyltransferase family 87 protein n=1 Tax=Phenylobacterium soli TaxID=2170551 RepID=UPI001403CAED|nr:glycosyltransferase family 87 protein [Phenylobacterium soli]
MSLTSAPTLRERLTTPVLLAVLLGFLALSLGTLNLLKLQPAGVDFAGLWAGGKAALTDIGKLYDFHYVSELQGWPLGPGKLRPYAYPPSALLLLTPFALAPWNLSYIVWTLATGAFFVWAGVKAGAPKWFPLIPWVAFAAFCGQATFLLGGLVMAGLALTSSPIIAGVLFGCAAAMKPQLLMLLPLALIAERRWTTIVATGVTGLVLCAVSAAVFGLQPWFEWLGALSRFEYLVSHARLLVANAITPYAALTYWRQEGSWALLLAPGAALWVWLTFRRGADLSDKIIALFGGAFLISPYAMNYELALFAPATAAYLARTRDPRWPAYAAAAVLQAIVLHPAFFSLAATLSLPLLKALPLPPFLGREPEASLIRNG